MDSLLQLLCEPFFAEFLQGFLPINQDKAQLSCIPLVVEWVVPIAQGQDNT